MAKVFITNVEKVSFQIGVDILGFPIYHVEKTIVSRETYKSALVMYHSPFVFTPVQRAWAFWYTTNCGFSNQILNCRFDKTSKNSKLLINKILEFSEGYSERLKYVQIENNDACAVIASHDTEHTFIYCDPPYVGANQGHYGGYTQEHFNDLLDALSKVKDKFLLSSYQNGGFLRYVNGFGWYQKEISLHLGTCKTKGKKCVENTNS